MLGGGSRRPTAHILRDAKEPHLVVTVPQELHSQAPLGEVALVRLRAGRAWTSAFQDPPLLLVTFSRVEAAHVSLFPELVAAIVEEVASVPGFYNYLKKVGNARIIMQE